jgi:hypothetical protein
MKLPPDIFTANLAMPDTVYILGSGIRGAKHHERIPLGAYVIAVNKAIAAPVEAELWMQFAKAWRYVRDKWFTRALASDVPKCFGISLLERCKLEGMSLANVDYCFDFMPQFHDEPNAYKFTEGILRTGGTISGAALQLCYWRNVKRVIFCGVDMLGHTFFDGTKLVSKAETKINPDGTDNDWGLELRDLNIMVELCKGAGMEVYSMSETALEVDRI